MKLSAARDNYYALSGTLSTVNRQLSFAGIAVVWIFAMTSGDDVIVLPRSLHWPLLFLVAALAFDLFHYAVATLIWGSFHRHHDKKNVAAEDDVPAPGWFNRPAITFLTLKVVFNLLGLAGLLWYIWGRLS